MVVRVLLHRRARADLAAIRRYIMEHGDGQSAERVRSHLQERIRRLGRFPGSGIQSSDAAIRILSPAKYPYRIYFTVTATAVVVLHIRHTSRQSPAPFDLGS